MLLIALTFFTVGAVVPALAQNFTVMLVGRSIQGVGGGGISALTYIIVTDMVTLKERGKWFGLITMMWAIGSVTGPVIGGALAEKASWVSDDGFKGASLYRTRTDSRTSAGYSGSTYPSAGLAS